MVSPLDPLLAALRRLLPPEQPPPPPPPIIAGPSATPTPATHVAPPPPPDSDPPASSPALDFGDEATLAYDEVTETRAQAAPAPPPPPAAALVALAWLPSAITALLAPSVTHHPAPTARSVLDLPTGAAYPAGLPGPFDDVSSDDGGGTKPAVDESAVSEAGADMDVTSAAAATTVPPSLHHEPSPATTPQRVSISATTTVATTTLSDHALTEDAGGVVVAQPTPVLEFDRTDATAVVAAGAAISDERPGSDAPADELLTGTRESPTAAAQLLAAPAAAAVSAAVVSAAADDPVADAAAPGPLGAATALPAATTTPLAYIPRLEFRPRATAAERRQRCRDAL
ncbi:hypothetical protein HK405_006434, partial [Cladochytrium tenue]